MNPKDTDDIGTRAAGGEHSENLRPLHGLLPAASPVISEALSVQGRGHEFFEPMRANDLEGIVVKRLTDPYDPRARWLKIKNPDYSQKERGEGSC